MSKTINDHRELALEAKKIASRYSSFSAVFRHLKNKTDIGDYFVAKVACREYLMHFNALSRQKIYTALQYSDEFLSLRKKGRMQWLDDIEEVANYYIEQNG